MNSQKEQEGHSRSQSETRRHRRGHPRGETDITWIPKANDLGTETGYFPWLLLTEQAPANPEYLDRVDDAQAARVFGEWRPETGLSDPAKKSLDALQYGFAQLEKQLDESDGDLGLPADELKKLPYVAGMLLPEYKAFIAKQIKDRREIRYILDQIEMHFLKLGKAMKDMMTRPIQQPAEKVEPEQKIHSTKALSQNALSAAYFVQLALDASYSTPQSPQSLQNMPLPDESTKVSLPMPLPDESTRVLLPPPLPRQESAAAATPEPTIQNIVPNAPTAAQTSQERRALTDIMRDELIAEGLIDQNEIFSDIVLVTMKRILTAFNEGVDQEILYDMVNLMKFDPGIDRDKDKKGEDISKLMLFTDRLLRQRK